MSLNHIIRVVECKDVQVKADQKVAKGYLMLVCEEWDTFNYRYRYVSKVPENMTTLEGIAELILTAYIENESTWFGAFWESVSDDDYICNYADGQKYKVSELRRIVSSRR